MKLRHLLIVLVLIVGPSAVAPLSAGESTEADIFARALAEYDTAIESQDPDHPGFAKALALWRSLMDADHNGARYHIGLFHYLGVGGATIDQPKGIDMIRKAAQSGYPTAQAFMGLMSENGDGVAVLRSEEQALSWYRLAADGNQCAAIKWMMRAYSVGYPGLEPSMAKAEALRKQLPNCTRR